ncbi:hypothetical protein CHY08_34205 (plasmid) [Rhizobium leguminosarum bv. viciae]|uniref:hypothetical protein n=1 Tax=Rhizobium leguminosarum TaxID=384 RepID=UPI000B8C8F98|nr:hypothetical protein [Rhizobium leguminosarum]ASR12110.1 hypothetical protein CHY08_34205 [Rhizobium leguminosarum bv. viciae]
MTLSELIEALEKATVTLRDVDIAIFKYLKPEYADYVEGRGGLVHTCDGSDQRVLSDVRWPSYTSSLDSAMHFAISSLDDGAVDIEVAHRVVGGKPHGRAEICGPRVFGMAKSKTPAMALVLATLKALQARGDA